MGNQNTAAEVYTALSTVKDKGGLRGEVRIFVQNEKGESVGVLDLFDGYQIGEGIGCDPFLNQSLDTAKKIFSNLAAGKAGYKVAKIAFGNAGHNFAAPKTAISPTVADVELHAATLIRASLIAGNPFVYNESGTDHRLVFIEKDIDEATHITYGENGDQFIVRVPISYDDFNLRDGGAETNETGYDDSLISYSLVDPSGDRIQFGEANVAGDAVLDQTEVLVGDNAGTPTYDFKNGLDVNGDVDLVNGGYRPQEISEILLSTDVIGAAAPYEKLATSRMTSGLLSFPEGFQFTYEWVLTWNFTP